MIFSCSSNNLDYSSLGLTEHRLDNGWNLYLDKGWTKTENYFHKGLSSSWCKIYVDPFLKIETNKFRDFPMYYNDTEVSNFQKLDKVIPVDGLVKIDNNIQIEYQQNFYPHINTKHISFSECHDILFDSLIENVNIFASTNHKPVYIPAQGGIDTLTVRSVFDYLKVDYKTFHLPIEATAPSPLRAKLSKNHWGFTQVEEKNDTVIVTGFYGDEWVLRNPYYVHVLLSQRGVNLTEEFDRTTSCYMKEYFENYREKCKLSPRMTVEELVSQVCNDFQIWHLHDTRYLSPMKHPALLELMTANNQTVIDQVTDAKLSKSIIERCSASLIDLADKIKNEHDPDYFWHD
jgi:hypothetical protein